MIEKDESVKAALIALELYDGATISEVRGQYLDKTAKEKFQNSILLEDFLQKEFDNYHRAYVTLLKHYEENANTSDLEYYPPDQIFQFHFNQGVHYFINQNYIKAGEKFQEAYKINNKSIGVLLYLGYLLLKRKNYYAAEKYFKEVVGIDKNNDDAWFYLGECYLLANEPRKALNMFETCKALNPGRHEVAFKIKEIKDVMMGKHPGAQKESGSFFKRLFKR